MAQVGLGPVVFLGHGDSPCGSYQISRMRGLELLLLLLLGALDAELLELAGGGGLGTAAHGGGGQQALGG